MLSAAAAATTKNVTALWERRPRETPRLANVLRTSRAPSQSKTPGDDETGSSPSHCNKHFIQSASGAGTHRTARAPARHPTPQRKFV